jgi:hypothetical protein
MALLRYHKCFPVSYVYSNTRSQVVELLLSLLLRLRGHVRVVHCSLEASSNIAKVLSFRVGLQIVELLLGLSLGFDAVVWVVNRTGSRYQYWLMTGSLEELHIPLETRSNVCGILVLLFRDLRLVVEVLIA